MSETQTDYVYRGSDRQTLAVKVRIDRPTGKNISWRRSSNGQAGPSGLNGAQIRDLPLYRLPELLAADPADPVVFTEGEKACEAARALGAVSVTNPGGAGQSDFGDSLAPLAGRAVYLWADNDPPGRALMDRIADRLDGIAAAVYRLDVPGLPEKGDAADFTGTAVDLADLITRAPRYRDWTAAEAWQRVTDLEQELSRERAERRGGLAPPADEAVEEALLGACLYGDDVYWTVESLTADDFYSARNARIWRAIEELVWDGRPANQVTVAHHLTEQGKLDFVGNHERLDRLARETPTSMDWHVQDWARTIKQTALRRRLIALASRIAQQAHDQPDIGPVLADIYAELARIELVGKGGLRPLSQVLDAHAPAMDAFEADPRTRGGVPTGIPPVDRITTGLHRSEMTVLAARTSEGKCLGRGTRVLMFDGLLKTVEDVVPGDVLMGDDSQPRRVLSITRGHGPMFKVRQSRGGITYRVNDAHVLSLRKAFADGYRAPKGQVIDLPVKDYLAASAKFRKAFKGFKVGVHFPHRDVPVDPYFLGLWLGDGDSRDQRITSKDEEIISWLEGYAGRMGLSLQRYSANVPVGSYAISGKRGGSPAKKAMSFKTTLGRLNVYKNKHIPHEYMANDRMIRLELLAGLIDSDGHFRGGGAGRCYEMTLKNERLIRQVKLLCDTLGFRTHLNTRTVSVPDWGINGATYWRLTISGDIDAVPVRVARKKAKPWESPKDWQVQSLIIDPDDDDDYFGFQLDGNNRFLLEDCTVTHNSQMALTIALNVARSTGPVALFSLEMDELQLGQRILSQFANIDPVAIQTRGWQPHELRAYREARIRAREARLFIDETEGLDSATIRARATRFVSQNPNAALICVDYSALVADRDGDTDTARLGRISKRLRGIARALRLPLLAICQLNREPEKRGGGRPGLTDIRSSDEFAQDAGAVWLLHQPTDSDGNKIEDRLILTVSKNRHGARNKDIPLFYNRATGRIGGME